MMNKEHAPIELGDILNEIQPPDLGGVLDLSDIQAKVNEPIDIFAEKKRKGWDKTVEARCDFTPRPRLTRRSGLYFLSYWQKSIYGRTLTDIKGDDSMVQFFADTMVSFIKELIGPRLSLGNWCIITTPKRRHLVKNFATRISEEIGARLSIPFYEDVCSCRTRQRVNAEFTVNVVPKEQNVICFDDFVTTGQTLQAMKRALEPFNKNLLFLSGINNKL
jgi:adenine/guanine phosphoribosyltransferase-like PRPP-binding protein